MTKGAIYGNFKDKDEIALEAFNYNYCHISDKIREIIKTKENACDQLVAFAGFYLDNFADISNKGGCPVLNAAIDSDNVHETLKDSVAKSLEDWIKNVSRIIYSGIKRNEVNKRQGLISCNNFCLHGRGWNYAF